MGFATSNSGQLEVRAWVGGGIAHPFNLYRIISDGDTVTGQHFIWSTAIADKGRRSIRKLMKKRCINELHRSDEIMWCEVRVSKHVEWDWILPDLLPSQLWELRDKSDLGMSPQCVVADGTIVGIELVQGTRYKHVSYGNPGMCCPHLQCAVVDRVQQVLTSNVWSGENRSN